MMNIPVTRPAVHRAAFAATLAFIIYGCLYPWEWRPRALPAGPLALLFDSWPAVFNRRIAADMVVNVLLYAPLGFFGFAAIGPRRPRLASIAPVAVSILLSGSVEMLQLFDPGRNCSTLDLAMNTAGAVAGVGLARRFRQRLESEAALPPPAPVMLIALWCGWQLSPLLPVTNLRAVRAGLRHILEAPFSPAALLLMAAAALAAGCLLEDAAGPRRARRLLAAALLLVPARVLVMGREVGAAEVLGAALGWLAWLALGRDSRRAAMAAWALTAAVVIGALEPFRPGPAVPFVWVPFQAFFDMHRAEALPALCRKLFCYGSAVWLWHKTGWRYSRIATMAAAVLTVLEAVQTRLPGRTPEVTDPLLALAAAAALSLTRGRGCTPPATMRVSISGDSSAGAENTPIRRSTLS